jgi:hypothetical protein
MTKEGTGIITPRKYTIIETDGNIRKEGDGGISPGSSGTGLITGSPDGGTTL